MIVWYILFAAASSSLPVSGSSPHTSGRGEVEGREWQMILERLRSRMQERLQSSFAENQRRKMLSSAEGARNPIYFMEMQQRQFQLKGGQRESSAPAERSAENKGIPIGYSGLTASVQLSTRKGSTLPLSTGQAPLSQLRHRAHSAAQYAPNQETPDVRGQPESSPPRQHGPSLRPSGPYETWGWDRAKSHRDLLLKNHRKSLPSHLNIFFHVT